MSTSTVLEATMLICFGFAWPLANVRMLRLRKAEGRGLLPTSLTLIGYLAGMAAKVVCACTGDGLAPIFWLYLLNAASVTLNLALQHHYRNRGAQDPSTDRGSSIDLFLPSFASRPAEARALQLARE